MERRCHHRVAILLVNRRKQLLLWGKEEGGVDLARQEERVGLPPATSLKLDTWRSWRMSLGIVVQRRFASSLLMCGPGNCKPLEILVPRTRPILRIGGSGGPAETVKSG